MCVLQHSPASCSSVSPARAQHLRGETFANRIDRVSRWLARRHQLRARSKLDDRLLADVGISRETADREIARTLWKTYSLRHMK